MLDELLLIRQCGFRCLVDLGQYLVDRLHSDAMRRAGCPCALRKCPKFQQCRCERLPGLRIGFYCSHERPAGADLLFFSVLAHCFAFIISARTVERTHFIG